MIERTLFRSGILALMFPLTGGAIGVSNAAPGVDTTSSVSVAISSGRAVDPQLTELQQQRERLVLENQVNEESVRKELAGATAEVQRLRSEADLERAKVDRELAAKKLEIDKAKLEVDEINARAGLENARRQKELQSELAALRVARERADLEAELATANFTIKNNEFRSQELVWNGQLAEVRGKLALREKQLEANAYAEQTPIYLKDPLKPDGSLVLSDRRIALNGPITMATADEISAQIDYFNNKTHDFPIFIVIDDSPGGSVMAGYKILKSMESSSAPVYVVVKSFAASMAAAITTLAQRSFAYPNAIILHHQISAGSAGNLTVQRESVKTLEEWWQRLAAPIAAKMGITIDDFIKEMYAHTTTGDWKEFADRAAKLKWVDVVIGRCQETAWIKDPVNDRGGNLLTATAGKGESGVYVEKVDGKGRPYLALPRLNPVDCYYLYNPDGYFRSE